MRNMVDAGAKLSTKRTFLEVSTPRW